MLLIEDDDEKEVLPIEDTDLFICSSELIEDNDEQEVLLIEDDDEKEVLPIEDADLFICSSMEIALSCEIDVSDDDDSRSSRSLSHCCQTLSKLSRKASGSARALAMRLRTASVIMQGRILQQEPLLVKTKFVSSDESKREVSSSRTGKKHDTRIYKSK